MVADRVENPQTAIPAVLRHHYDFDPAKRHCFVDGQQGLDERETGAMCKRNSVAVNPGTVNDREFGWQAFGYTGGSTARPAAGHKFRKSRFGLTVLPETTWRNRIPSGNDPMEIGRCWSVSLATWWPPLYVRKTSGEWQGIVKAGPQETRRILRIAKKEDGARCASIHGNWISRIPLWPLSGAGDCARE